MGHWLGLQIIYECFVGFCILFDRILRIFLEFMIRCVKIMINGRCFVIFFVFAAIWYNNSIYLLCNYCYYYSYCFLISLNKITKIKKFYVKHWQQMNYQPMSHIFYNYYFVTLTYIFDSYSSFYQTLSHQRIYSNFNM